MSSKSNQDSQSTGQNSAKEAGAQSRLPFEPAQNRKKTPKKPVSTPAVAAKPDTSKQSNSEKIATATSARKASAPIPEVVSKRMGRRMGFFCGIPTSFGMLTFVVSYFLVSQHLLKVPTVAVLLVSMGFFGLGVLGLSYGALSASWDEDRLGSWLGWQEFTKNVGVLTASWRSLKQNSDSKS